jgi:ferrous-iron efflux pump FieF
VLSSYFGLLWADAAMAIAIAFIVMWSNRSIGIRAFNNLMDREMPDAEKAAIVAMVAAIPEIRGQHNLKTRYSGTKAFIQMHVEVDASLNFREAHAIIDRLEKAIMARFEGADVIVHPDPVD